MAKYKYQVQEIGQENIATNLAFWASKGYRAIAFLPKVVRPSGKAKDGRAYLIVYERQLNDGE